MIPVVRGKMFKRIIKVNHRLALELAIQKEVISAQKQPSYEKSVALKSLGEKSCKIKGGGQQMAAMMLMLLFFKAAPFSQLGCFCADNYNYLNYQSLLEMTPNASICN